MKGSFSNYSLGARVENEAQYDTKQKDIGEAALRRC